MAVYVHCSICGKVNRSGERCEYCTPANLAATFGEKYAAHKLTAQECLDWPNATYVPHTLPTCQGCGKPINPSRYGHHYCQHCSDQYLETCSGCQGNTGGTWANPHGCSDCYNTGLQEKTNKGAHDMNVKEIVTLVQLTQGATVIAASYKTEAGKLSNVYHFKDVLGLGLQSGDTAVVQTRDTFQLVSVLEVGVPHHKITCPLADLKHVVQKVDVKALDRVIEAESKAANELALSELHERLETMSKQIGGSGFAKVQALLGKAPVEDDTVVEVNVYGSPTEMFKTSRKVDYADFAATPNKDGV